MAAERARMATGTRTRPQPASHTPHGFHGPFLGVQRCCCGIGVVIVTAATATGTQPTVATTAAILEALMRHYRKPGAARGGEILIPEVAAPRSDRRADLVRVGMWASRGTGIDVHEIKATRSDWLRELDNPAKAEAWWPHCNRFWLVTPPGLVHDGELPPEWGLMELPASGRRFKTRVPAITRDVRLTAELLVELLRRQDNQRLGEIDEIRQRHRLDIDQMYDTWRREAVVAGLPAQVRERLDMLKVIEDALGMPLEKWAGFSPTPVTAVAPAELAAYLADAAAHVALQRRAASVERETVALRRAAEATLLRLQDMQGTATTGGVSQ